MCTTRPGTTLRSIRGKPRQIHLELRAPTQLRAKGDLTSQQVHQMPRDRQAESHTLPLPGLMKMVVAPVVESEFEKLVDKYIANLIKRFGGEA